MNPAHPCFCPIFPETHGPLDFSFLKRGHRNCQKRQSASAGLASGPRPPQAHCVLTLSVPVLGERRLPEDGEAWPGPRQTPRNLPAAQTQEPDHRSRHQPALNRELVHVRGRLSVCLCSLCISGQLAVTSHGNDRVASESEDSPGCPV